MMSIWGEYDQNIQQNITNRQTRIFRSDIKDEDKGLVWEKHKPVRIQYNHTDTCSSRTKEILESSRINVRVNPPYLAVSALVMMLYKTKVSTTRQDKYMLQTCLFCDCVPSVKVM